MARKQRRRFSADEKLRILEEARQPHTTVAEVLRRHGLDAATYYRWERVAKAGMREALAERPRQNGRAEREVDRLRTELEQKRRIIAEVVEENLALKKGSKFGRADPVPRRGEGRGAGPGGAHASAHGVATAAHPPAAGCVEEPLS